MLAAGSKDKEMGAAADEDAMLSDLLLKAMPSTVETDPYCRPDFDVIAHINTLFPTEQSLSQIDDVMEQVQHEITDLDAEIAELVQTQSATGQQGHAALLEAKSAMQELFTRIREIQAKTETSESMVKEITRDIKQLDVAKRNLTASITTLHHLHILLSGLDNLGGWIDKRQYAEIAAQLPAVLNVLVLFEPYMAVPQVKQLADEVKQLKDRLCSQVVSDFKQEFVAFGAANRRENVLNICRVVSVLDPAVKNELSAWFVEQQLSEYYVLYADTEDIAWLDRIDQRYRWFVAKLTEFEKGGASGLFPADWEMGRRLTTEFCNVTREMLDRLMCKRSAELDAKLLTHAINHTSMFESLLCKRFPGGYMGNPASVRSQFDGIVWSAFDKHMHVYVAKQDKNMAEFIEQCATRIRSGEERPVSETSTQAYPLPSSADMFMFFKRTIRESTKLSTNPQKLLADLVPVFKKCLRGYAHGCLTAFLPKVSGGVSSATTAGLLQNLLKEGQVPRLSKDEQFLTCCILATADWCAETAQQLQDKLREKLVEQQPAVGGEPSPASTGSVAGAVPVVASAVDFSLEVDMFYNIISSALTVLVQDLESACDAALQTMTKISWASVESVGDESGYVSAIRNHLKLNVPRIRDFLTDRRKYFGHFCLKFATQFMAKYHGTLFRCRPVSVTGAEQLLLDTHSLKTFLLNLPNVDSAVAPRPPTTYVKLVNKAMNKAEMILKVVMSDVVSTESFVQNYAKLLPESDSTELQKVLEMKGLRRTEQVPLIELYRTKFESSSSRQNAADFGKQTAGQMAPSMAENLASQLGTQLGQLAAGLEGDSRIRQLERLVKKKL